MRVLRGWCRGGLLLGFEAVCCCCFQLVWRLYMHVLCYLSVVKRFLRAVQSVLPSSRSDTSRVIGCARKLHGLDVCLLQHAHAAGMCLRRFGCTTPVRLPKGDTRDCHTRNCSPKNVLPSMCSVVSLTRACSHLCAQKDGSFTTGKACSRDLPAWQGTLQKLLQLPTLICVVYHSCTCRTLTNNT
jgi:hypothetical protein